VKNEISYAAMNQAPYAAPLPSAVKEWLAAERNTINATW
jgi:hypothetical protein